MSYPCSHFAVSRLKATLQIEDTEYEPAELKGMCRARITPQEGVEKPEGKVEGRPILSLCVELLLWPDGTPSLQRAGAPHPGWPMTHAQPMPGPCLDRPALGYSQR